jgi:hypothetical protein
MLLLPWLLASSGSSPNCNLEIDGEDLFIVQPNITNDGVPVYKLWSYTPSYLYRVTVETETRWVMESYVGPPNGDRYTIDTATSADLITNTTWYSAKWNSTTDVTSYVISASPPSIVCAVNTATATNT